MSHGQGGEHAGPGQDGRGLGCGHLVDRAGRGRVDHRVAILGSGFCRLTYTCCCEDGCVEITTIVPLVAPAASGPVPVVGFRYWNVSDPVDVPGCQAIDDGV